MPAIDSYTYTKLDETRQEIRFISVLPSDNHDDPVRLTISHLPFMIKEKTILKEKPDIDAINLTLPEGWVAHETIEGRVLFYTWDEDEQKYPTVTWKHPILYVGEFGEKYYGNSSMRGVYELNDADTFEPKYDALSYTWGSRTETETAYVVDNEDGAEDSIRKRRIRSFEITENLAVALKHLRYSDRPRRMWVDAICINQLDVEERNNQVLRMSDLYKHADQVVVWLGTSLSNSAMALETMEHIGKQIEYTIDQYVMRSPDAEEDVDWSDFDYLPFGIETWEAIWDLISRSWFDRLWVVQEIQLANARAVLQCGKHQIRWYYLRRAMICLRNKIAHIPESMIERVLAVGKMCDPILGWSLPDLLVVNNVKKCINPLDRIYGVLALAPEGFAATLKPDYTLSLVDGYRATFLEYTSQSQRLSLLHHCNPKSVGPEWPSWIPNWWDPDPETLHFYLNSHASGDSAAHWDHLEPDVLRVTGVQVSTVSWVSNWVLTSAGNFDRLIDEIGIEAMENSREPSGDSLLDAYIYTLCRGQLEESLDVLDTPSYSTLSEIRRQILNLSVSRTSVLSDPDLRWKAERRVVRTRNGYIGMAPENVKKGDLACVLLGGNLPTILRPASNGTFKVIGHSYIHGIMHGEALLGPVPKPWTPRRRMNWRGGHEACFKHTVTEEIVGMTEDPRLYVVSEEWERLDNDDPHRIQKWKNKETGEIINSDPRLLPNALIERGVRLQTFTLT